MVKIGKLCVDKYEASVWSIRPDPVTGEPRGTRYGEITDDYPCLDNGNNCHKSLPTKIFAASVPGVKPSIYITWFQAQQACANVGKRLPRNEEWQMAAAGTPDGDLVICNFNASETSLTGSRSLCVSHWGVYDMMGNVYEWVEDWIQPNTVDVGFTSTDHYGNDTISGVNEAFPFTDRFPAAPSRGGRLSQQWRRCLCTRCYLFPFFRTQPATRFPVRQMRVE